MAVHIPDAVNATQSEWRFCGLCFSLFWNGDRNNNKGKCAGTPGGSGGHQAAGWDFHLLADPDNTPNRASGSGGPGLE